MHEQPTNTMVKNIDTERHPFSGSMKMADLVEVNFRILGVMTRLGMRFGFGDDTVDEACRKNGVDTDTFLLIGNVYTFDNYSPSVEFLRKVNLENIVKYLHQSHSYYMEIALRDLEDSIEEMLHCCDSIRKKIIHKFFLDYKDELGRHFEYEEKTVFPYVESVLESRGKKDFSILQYEDNHTNVDEKLDDLKSIVMRYLPPEVDNNLILKVLSNIHVLEVDLRKHTSIEDDILVPVVKGLEEKIREDGDGR